MIKDSLKIIPMLFSLFLFIYFIGYFQIIIYQNGISEKNGLFLKSFNRNFKPGDFILFINPRLDLNPTKEIFKHITEVNRDKYWVRGSHKFALDSRYFGYLDKKDILYKYILLKEIKK